jgi:hypothetical protein
MTVDEFETFIVETGLINDMLAQRDLGLVYYQAMMLQVDEINQDRHMRMTFIEFLEAFARACDKASHSPI